MARPQADIMDKKIHNVKFSERDKQILESMGLKLHEGCSLALREFIDNKEMSQELKELKTIKERLGIMEKNVMQELRATNRVIR